MRDAMTALSKIVCLIFGHRIEKMYPHEGLLGNEFIWTSHCERCKKPLKIHTRTTEEIIKVF